MTKKEFGLALGITALIIYIVSTVGYFLYTVDLLTDFKPCIGIGNYCSYYTETEHCYIGSDYLICDTIGDGIGYD